MDPATKYLWQNLSDLDAPVEDPAPKASPAKVLRLVEPVGDINRGSLPMPLSSSKDWSKLIDLVRDAGNHAREVEAQAQDQELRVQEVLDRVREDVRNAAERVRAAEARTAEIQSRADALLKAADEKLKAAEERARIAEEWLARVYDTIASEFAIEPASKQTA